MNTPSEHPHTISGLDPFALAETRLAGLRALMEDSAQLTSLANAEAEIAALRAQLANGQITPAAASSAIATLVSSVEQASLQPKQHAVTSMLKEARANAHAYLSASAEQIDALTADALSLYGNDLSEEERTRLDAARREERAALEAGELHTAFDARRDRLALLEDIFERNGDDARLEATRSHRAELEEEAAKLAAAEARDTEARQTTEASRLAEPTLEEAAQDEQVGAYFTALGITDLLDGAEITPPAANAATSAGARER